MRGIDGGLVAALRDGGARLGMGGDHPAAHRASSDEPTKRDWHGVDAEPETG